MKTLLGILIVLVAMGIMYGIGRITTRIGERDWYDDNPLLTFIIGVFITMLLVVFGAIAYFIGQSL